MARAASLLLCWSQTSSTTIRVGSSSLANTSSIARGVALVPAGRQERWTVLVEPGVYRERVWIQPSLGPLTLQGLGQPEDTTLIFHCCPGGDGTPSCANATVDPACAPQHPGEGIRGVETLLVEANDFELRNMTVANDACWYNHNVAQQSETVQLLADRSFFQHARFLGAQDTIYSGSGGKRQYLLDSFVNGSVDSIYGLSSMVLERCELAITGYVTAQRGAQLEDGSRSTYLILDSKLTKPKKGDQAFPALQDGTDLGRPWGSLAAVVYKNTFMEEHISARGWNDWGHACKSQECHDDLKCWCQNVTFAEYRSHGPGASEEHLEARAGWSRQLSDQEASTYTAESVLRNWLPHSLRQFVV